MTRVFKPREWYIIRAKYGTRADLRIEAESPLDAMVCFGDTIGLTTIGHGEMIDRDGLPYLDFTIGTRNEFVTFRALDQ